MPLDRRLMRGFRRAVLEATAAIPYGANRKLFAGGGGGRRQPAAVRAAGTALATNPLPIIVPCHRVLRADWAGGGPPTRWGAAAT